MNGCTHLDYENAKHKQSNLDVEEYDQEVFKLPEEVIDNIHALKYLERRSFFVLKLNYEIEVTTPSRFQTYATIAEDSSLYLDTYLDKQRKHIQNESDDSDSSSTISMNSNPSSIYESNESENDSEAFYNDWISSSDSSDNYFEEDNSFLNDFSLYLKSENFGKYLRKLIIEDNLEFSTLKLLLSSEGYHLSKLEHLYIQLDRSKNAIKILKIVKDKFKSLRTLEIITPNKISEETETFALEILKDKPYMQIFLTSSDPELNPKRKRACFEVL